MTLTGVGSESRRPSEDSLVSNLPDGYVVRSYSHMRGVQRAAEEIVESLDEKKNSNQWLVILGLSKGDIQQIDEDGHCLGGVNYRFQWEGTTGLFKIVPSMSHGTVTAQITRFIDGMFPTHGISISNALWVRTTTYKGLNKGKQADDAFLPPSRQAGRSKKPGWPTLVIETGVSESLPQLRADAKKWFADSEGDVRMVLLVGIKPHRVDLELWQLAPHSAPRPLTKAFMDSLCAQQPNMAPLSQQVATVQQPYCAHKVVITQGGSDGGPMVIPFQAFYDKPPTGQQSDFVLTDQDFETIVGGVLW